jgi:penicillin amidase
VLKTDTPKLDHASLMAAMRGERAVGDICRAIGITLDEFSEERSALLAQRLPPENQTLQAGVNGTVEILRDRAGVPHVYAGSTPDLYYGLGFAMAQDRLWQMDRLRRRALGRQAEILGAEYVASDLIHLLVGIPAIAEAEVPLLDDRMGPIVDSLLAGINRQIEASKGVLPIEFSLLSYDPEPFTACDVIAILRGMWWSLNGRLEGLVTAEISKLLPEQFREAYLTPEAPAERIVPPMAAYPGAGLPLTEPQSAVAGMGDLTGSNNWAVAGTHTESGHAILGSDPHQPFWLPTSWYEFGLHGPEDDAAGAGHPGVPGLWWGSNGDSAWGITNNGSSTKDLYVEEVDPNDPTRYREGNGWERFTEEPISIAVRGEEPRKTVRRCTVRGPIMNEALSSVTEGGDPPLSLRWVGQEHLNDIRACVQLGRARDWDGFRAALSDWSVPIFNFVYADRAGKVGFQCAGRVPVRGRITPGYRQANNPDDVWQGYIPFDGMPRLENPGRGWVGSANNRVAPDDFPFPLYGSSAAGYRALRIKEVMEDPRPFTIERGRALLSDVKGTRPGRIIPPLLRRLKGQDDPEIQLLTSILCDWDGRYALDSSAPAVFETFMRAWQLRVAAERLPRRLVEKAASQGGIPARLIVRDDLDWFAGGTVPALAATAKEAISLLRDRHGPDPAGWRWETVHQAHWRHVLSNPATADVLDLGPQPVAGAGDTICNTGLGVPPNFAASGGVEYRLLVDFAAPDRFLAVQNTGNSGQPGSPHYADQFTPWATGNYHTVHLTREGVEADLEGQTTLTPE